MMKIMFLELIKISNSLFRKTSKRVPSLKEVIMIVESLVRRDTFIFFFFATELIEKE